MFKKLTVIAAVPLAVLLFAGSVLAEDTADVDILVQPSVTVSLTAPTTYYDFGVLEVGTSSNSAEAITLTNDGEVGVDLSAEVTYDGTWTLADTAGHDQFQLHMGTSATSLTEGADEFKTLVGGIDELYIDLGTEEGENSVNTWYWIYMPTTVSDTEQQTFTIQVTAQSR